MTAGVFLFCYDVLMLNEYIKKRIEDTSCPRTREASEPLFEEQSDAAKVSEMPYPPSGSGKNLGKECGG